MKRILAASLISIAAVGVHAEGAYFGLGYGQGKIKIDSLNIPGVSESIDDKAPSYKLFGGYEISKNFAVEVGYQSFHRFNATASDTAPSILIEDTDITGLYVDAIGKLPVGGGFSMLGKLGVMQAKTEVSCLSTGNFGLTCPGASANSTNFRLGLGIEYAATKSAAIRIDLERTSKVGKEESTGTTDLDFVGLGLTYRF
jgi:OOP family OmpA-OmpF porin